MQGTQDKINDAEERATQWQKKTVEAEKARDDIKSKLRELNTKAQKQIFDLNHNFKDLTAEIQKLNKEKSIQVNILLRTYIIGICVYLSIAFYDICFF